VQPWCQFLANKPLHLFVYISRNVRDSFVSIIYLTFSIKCCSHYGCAALRVAIDIHRGSINKKALLSQGNCAMPQLFVSV